MGKSTANRETMIALRATREAIHVAREVDYPRIACGPATVSDEWIKEKLREQALEYRPIMIEYISSPTNEPDPAPRWLVVFLYGCIGLVILMVVGTLIKR